jgi:hypothetical protein
MINSLSWFSKEKNACSSSVGCRALLSHDKNFERWLAALRKTGLK